MKNQSVCEEWTGQRGLVSGWRIGGVGRSRPVQHSGPLFCTSGPEAAFCSRCKGGMLPRGRMFLLPAGRCWPFSRATAPHWTGCTFRGSVFCYPGMFSAFGCCEPCCREHGVHIPVGGPASTSCGRALSLSGRRDPRPAGGRGRREEALPAAVSRPRLLWSAACVWLCTSGLTCHRVPSARLAFRVVAPVAVVRRECWRAPAVWVSAFPALTRAREQLPLRSGLPGGR